MTTVTQTGYERDTQGAWISKDPNARLLYTLDWSEWLLNADTIASSTVTVQSRANDAAPLVKVSSSNTTNQVLTTLSGGNPGKVYTVTVQVTTTNSLIDRRSFRIKVENRSA
jgi:hypothetical protein